MLRRPFVCGIIWADFNCMNKNAKIKFNKKYFVTHFVFILLVSFSSIFLYNLFAPRLETMGIDNKIATSSDDYIGAETTLYFKPTEGQYTVGSTFSTALFIDTATSINVEDVDIVFPTNNLEVLSISKSNSINSLWTEEPNFDNNKGVISFMGGIYSPGFVGKEGKILTINFRVKKEGNAQLKLDQIHIFADDGSGTELLANAKSALFGLSKQPTVPANLGTGHSDFNGDGKVDSTDLSIMLSARGTNRKAQDLNGDGRVNSVDISIFLKYYKK